VGWPGNPIRFPGIIWDVRSLIVFTFSVALLLGLLAGCASSTDVAETPGTAESTSTTASAEPANFHKNEEGKALCPFMKVVIDDPANAVGYVDYEGTRYYLCCDSCLAKAKDDPSSIAQALKT